MRKIFIIKHIYTNLVKQVSTSTNQIEKQVKTLQTRPHHPTPNFVIM